jgi:hypothetical protein
MLILIKKMHGKNKALFDMFKQLEPLHIQQGSPANYTVCPTAHSRVTEQEVAVATTASVRLEVVEAIT